jgi:hypothetical protein
MLKEENWEYNQQQQQVHNQFSFQSRAAAEKQQVSKLSQTMNMLPPKIIVSATQTNRPKYTDNISNVLQTKVSEIYRQQPEQPARQPNQFYQQQEQTIDDNDDEDVFDMIDHQEDDDDLFDLA